MTPIHRKIPYDNATLHVKRIDAFRRGDLGCNNSLTEEQENRQHYIFSCDWPAVMPLSIVIKAGISPLFRSDYAYFKIIPYLLALDISIAK